MEKIIDDLKTGAEPKNEIEVVMQSSQNKADAMIQFQRVMRQFVDTHRQIMHAYLNAYSHAEEPLENKMINSSAVPEKSAIPSKTGSVEKEGHKITDKVKKIDQGQSPQRAIFGKKLLSMPDSSLPLPIKGVIIVTDDEHGIAKKIVLALERSGHKVALIRLSEKTEEVKRGYYTGAIDSADGANKIIQLIHSKQGLIGGILHLLPLKDTSMHLDMDLSRWQTLLRSHVKSLFYLLKALANDLHEAAKNGGACVVSSTAMGVKDNSESQTEKENFFPGHGGIAGILKTVALEWPKVKVKLIDINIESSESILTQTILGEIASEDRIVEVGYDGFKRFGLSVKKLPMDMKIRPSLHIDRKWIFLITGGARGITAEVACDLAKKYKATFILVGRSPVPTPKEPPETAGLSEPSEIKAALISKIRSQKTVFSLAEVERMFSRIIKERAMRNNLNAIKSAGAQVHYHQLDVRDEQAMGILLDNIYSEYGCLDGVIHGAGIIEDKRLEDKTEDSFDRVFDTKVDSAFILSRKLRPESLKLLVFFASVAGRFGNEGQSDYAAANEVLNKLSVYLDQRWQARVVAINWGPWETTGMVSESLKKHFRQRGIELIPNSVGCQMLEQEILFGQKGEPEIIIGGIKGWKEDNIQAPAEKTLHFPLIGKSVLIERNGDGSVEIVKKLDAHNDLFLRDHQLNGFPVVPAAFAMELISELVSASWPEMELLRLRDVSVLKGIVLNNGPLSIRIRAKEISRSPEAEAAGIIEIQTDIVDIEPSQRPYYRATIEVGPQTPLPPLYSKEKPSELSEFPLSLKDAYKQWLFHGTTLQCISEIQGMHKHGIIASITPSYPGICLNQPCSGDWIIDPIVIDSGFQLAILWAKAYHGFTPLPSRFPEFIRYGSLSGNPLKCYLHIQAKSDSLIMRTDLYFVDSQNRILGCFKGAESTCSRDIN